MKFVFSHAKQKMKNCAVVSFFFNARGETLEKSTIGMFRSLILQLLDRVPRHQCGSLNLSPSLSTYQSNIEALKELFEHVVQLHAGLEPLVCFVDALDECEEEEVRDMVRFFQYLGELCVSEGIRFYVCFSSRHYPHIKLNRGLNLVLEGQEGHAEDIATYIQAELHVEETSNANELRTQLREKASGVFMWVVLVVDILNRESDNGNVHRLREKLKTIPGRLHDLFRDILTRDENNKDRLLLCIQWVLFAKKPLRPEELYFAILAGAEPDVLRTWFDEGIEATDDVVRRFILSSSKGLVEVTKSKVPTGQYIHESIRDFLLKEDGLREIWVHAHNDTSFEGMSHDKLKQCCLNYYHNINILWTDEKFDSPDSAEDCKPGRSDGSLPQYPGEDGDSAFSGKGKLQVHFGRCKRGSGNPIPTIGCNKKSMRLFPFLEYAVNNVLYHADVAQGEEVSQLDFLQGSFDRGKWITFKNSLEKYSSRHYTSKASLLYLLATEDLANLVQAVPDNDRYLDVEPERYGAPLLASIATKSGKAFEAFIRLELERSSC